MDDTILPSTKVSSAAIKKYNLGQTTPSTAIETGGNLVMLGKVTEIPLTLRDAAQQAVAQHSRT
jgi:hypothetical protein